MPLKKKGKCPTCGTYQKGQVAGTDYYKDNFFLLLYKHKLTTVFNYGRKFYGVVFGDKQSSPALKCIKCGSFFVECPYCHHTRSLYPGTDLLEAFVLCPTCHKEFDVSDAYSPFSDS